MSKSVVHVGYVGHKNLIAVSFEGVEKKRTADYEEALKMAENLAMAEGTTVDDGIAWAKQAWAEINQATTNRLITEAAAAGIWILLETPDGAMSERQQTIVQAILNRLGEVERILGEGAGMVRLGARSRVRVVGKTTGAVLQIQQTRRRAGA